MGLIGGRGRRIFCEKYDEKIKEDFNYNNWRYTIISYSAQFYITAIGFRAGYW
jgi:hypothetical protein